MSRTDDRQDSPRAVIHKRILDVAATRPEASHRAIADEVAGATPALVERVFEEYGDPASDGADDDAEPDPKPGADATGTPDGTPTDKEDAMHSNGHHDGGTDEDDTASDGAGEAGDGRVTEDTAVTDGPESDDDGDGRDGAATGTRAEQDESPAEADPPGSESDASDVKEASALSPRQRETLRLVREHPDWSQGDLAEALDVSRATVCRRLNDIPGFDWQERASFARRVFDGPDGEGKGEGDGGDGDGAESHATGRTDTAGASGGGEASNGPEAVDGTGAGADAGPGALADVTERLERLEARVTDGDVGGAASAGLPPELAHKVVHACMESDRITEEEELRVLEALMRS